MILYVIDIMGTPPPNSRVMIEPIHRVEIIARKSQIFGDGGIVQHIKSDQYALVHALVDLGRLSGLEKIGEWLAFERPDHLLAAMARSSDVSGK
jgi:hypothetical protein